MPLEYQRRVDIVRRYHSQIQNLETIPPRFVKDGSILQNVLEGDAVDVLRCPVPRHHEVDRERFIGTSDWVSMTEFDPYPLQWGTPAPTAVLVKCDRKMPWFVYGGNHNDVSLGMEINSKVDDLGPELWAFGRAITEEGTAG